MLENSLEIIHLENVSIIEVGYADNEAINACQRLMLKYRESRHPDVFKWEGIEWERIYLLGKRAREGRYQLWLVIPKGGTVREAVGFAGLTENEEISPCWIDEAYRGQGIHKVLLRARIDAGGWRAIIREDNVACQKNFVSHGFVKNVEVEPGHWSYYLLNTGDDYYSIANNLYED